MIARIADWILAPTQSRLGGMVMFVSGSFVANHNISGVIATLVVFVLIVPVAEVMWKHFGKDQP